MPPIHPKEIPAAARLRWQRADAKGYNTNRARFPFSATGTLGTGRSSMYQKLTLVGLVTLTAALLLSRPQLTAQRRSFGRPSGLYQRSNTMQSQALMTRLRQLERRVGDLERLLQRPDTKSTVSVPDVAEAQRQLTASHQHFEFARQSYRKGYISQAEFEASDFDFQRAKKRLEMAKAADRPAELKELQLDIDTLDAQEDLALAKRRLKYATHIAAQGYPDQAAVEAHRQLVVDAETRLRELTGPTQTDAAAPPVPAPPAEAPPQPPTP
ncbi:MAG: hypothetical protein CMJ70_26945 [Planctomycetaceae bacterium]|nr:hypothetical protein [Planctomycetaceae bacterium]